MTYKDVGNAERCMEQRRPLRAHLLHMDVPHRDFLRSRMPWVQEALERPCAWVALDEIRFMLRGRWHTDGQLASSPD